MWIVGLILLGLQLVGALLRPRPRSASLEPSSLGDLDFPTSDETRPIPVVFGTCHVKAPNVLWLGDYEASPIKEKLDAPTPFSSAKTVITGYRYYLGLQYGLCIAPAEGITELREIRFDDKALPPGRLEAETGKNAIVFARGAAPPWTTAEIPAGVYASMEELAVAAEAAMRAAIDAPWKVVPGLEIIPGRTDQLIYSIEGPGADPAVHQVTLRPGRNQTPFELATEVARALNASEASLPGGARGTFSAVYKGSLGRFTISFAPSISGYTGFRLHVDSGFDFDRTALVTLGFATDASPLRTGPALSDYAVYPERFTIALQGDDGKLRLSDPSFTAKALLGFAAIPAGGDATIGSIAADYSISVTGTIYRDAGDFVRIDVQAPNLFGGDRGEGGIVGTIDVFKGASTQASSDYLELQRGAPVPGYPYLCHAVARHLYLGTNLYIKPISFVLSCYWNSLGIGGGKERIGTDANPAAMLYECIVNKIFGRGRDPAKVDTQSFLDAADTLFAEGLGLSMMIDAQIGCDEFIQEIERHIDGVVTKDPETGLTILRLCRADYTVSELQLIDEDVATLESYVRPSWGELRNAVRIRYIDQASDFMERLVTAQNLADIQARDGQEISEEIAFRGLSNAENAQKRAARALKAVSYPAARLRLAADRRSWKLRPGDPFRWSNARLGITDLPCRVGRVRRGRLEAGRIQIEAIEDIFGVPWTAYEAPSAPDWPDPATLPPPLLAARADEIPYAILDAEENRVMTLGIPDAGAITEGYEVWTDPTGADAYALTERCLTPTPSATLATAAPAGASTITLNDGYDLASIGSLSAAEQALGRNLVLIDDELIAFQFIERTDAGGYELSGLARGVADTTPAAHAAGARAWVISGGLGLAKPSSYPLGATISVKLAAFNRRGSVALSRVAEIQVLAAGRSSKPYSPTGLTLNSVSYPENVADDLVVDWADRDRLADWSYADSGETAAPEAGTHYRLRIYGEADDLLRTVDPATGPYTYPRATELADSGALGRLNESLRVNIETIRDADGAVSTYPIDYRADAAGWGMLWGQYWGGGVG